MSASVVAFGGGGVGFPLASVAGGVEASAGAAAGVLDAAGVWAGSEVKAKEEAIKTRANRPTLKGFNGIEDIDNWNRKLGHYVVGEQS